MIFVASGHVYNFESLPKMVFCCFQVTKWAVQRLGLTMHRRKCAEDLSGGNKRKLSTAIALVGNPSVIFLVISFLINHLKYLFILEFYILFDSTKMVASASFIQ